MILLKLSTKYQKILKLYTKYIEQILISKNTKYNLIFLPKKRKRITLLKSPHVHKKAQEHFEKLNYKATFYIYIKKNTLIKYLINNKPNSIFLKIEYNN